MVLSIIMWSTFGVVVGFSAMTLIYKGDSKKLVPLITLGVTCALIGGLFGQIVADGKSHFNSITPIISFLGAVILISFYKNISPQR